MNNGPNQQWIVEACPGYSNGVVTIKSAANQAEYLGVTRAASNSTAVEVVDQSHASKWEIHLEGNTGLYRQV